MDTDDWDPTTESVHEVRARCPVAHSERLGWSLLTYDDVLAALLDHTAFSNRVSSHIAIPNGMDPPEHTRYRHIVDECFDDAVVAAFEPRLRLIVRDLLRDVDEVEVMSQIAQPFAARAQCGYLEWSQDAATALQAWAHESVAATAAQDRRKLTRVADAFDVIIRSQLQRPAGRAIAPLFAHGLTEAEMVAVVRNWTAGELGTIAAAVGIIVEFLGRHRDAWQRLREAPDLRQAAMDEMLRLDAPLVANRRRTMREVEMSGRTISADAPVTILWPAAQRDPRHFPDADEFRWDREPHDNLLYGRGIHYCPGEGLSRLELGVFLDEFLQAVPAFEVVRTARAVYPAGGFSEVLIRLG